MAQVRKKSTSHQQANSKGFVKILAGGLKGKRLDVITSPGLRPTGSRSRETFFNWVQFELAGRRTLDLFSGSGALGFEAYSRGVKSVLMCEYSRDVYLTLCNNYKAINKASLADYLGFLPEVKIQQVDSYAWIKQKAKESFDLVFVDPPFMEEKELTVLQDLANNGYLANEALIFLQLDAAYKELMHDLDNRFTIRKEKKLGNVLLFLLDYQKA